MHRAPPGTDDLDTMPAPLGSGVKTTSLRGPTASIETNDARYEPGVLLASGGQGDIYRVYDRRLRRQMVMKVLDAQLTADSISIARFIQEAQVTAQLQHPSIVPVHDIGALVDGRPFYTMTEVRGRTLSSVIADVHAASRDGWATEPGGFSFGRLIDSFEHACEAVGYAHSCGVIHRDIKPQNVMLGEFGETLVLDWGLARFVGAPAEQSRPLSTIRQDSTSFASEVGMIVGTKGYMPPEQACGDHVGPSSDVYSLGMILREILSGERISQVTPFVPSPKRPIAEELLAILACATAADPADRYRDGRELARAVAAFIGGDRKRERALALLAEAQAMQPQIARMREEAAELERSARGVLDVLPPHADSALKEPGWELADRARDLLERADLFTFEMTRLVGSSLIETDLPQAHALLAAHYRELHEAAERTRDPAAVQLEVMLRTHDRGEHAAYLAGTGALTFATDPPARIELRRYVLRGRRRVDEHVAHLYGPLVARELPHGDYVLVLRADGYHDVRYPISIGRHEHWSALRPGASEPAPIALPRLGTLAD
ncbi:MAG TPA: serine/threonine-protein kinase, partial [Kofleriaceae bacterium]|nr:serine/threonine-protein kinase [Kofleriaceae bacterium]